MAGLTRSPLAAAFFLLAASERLPVGEICRPAVASVLAAEAAIQLNPWTAYARRARAEVLGRGPEVAGLARATLADPGSAWWWEPGGRLQVSVGDAAGDPASGPHDAAWSGYAQRPLPWSATSTPFDGGSGLHVALAARVGDLDPQYPLRQVELTVSADARVHQIRSPEDWRALALRHPMHRTGSGTDPDGLASDVAPDWSRVAEEWDGVHLTFGGLLAASLVPLGGTGDRTALWTWESEQTVWLRDMAVERVELPPLAGPPAPGVQIGRFELAVARPIGSRSLAHLTSGRPGLVGWFRRRRRGTR